MAGPACANGEPSVPGRPPRPHQRGPGAATRGHAETARRAEDLADPHQSWAGLSREGEGRVMPSENCLAGFGIRDIETADGGHDGPILRHRHHDVHPVTEAARPRATAGPLTGRAPWHDREPARGLPIASDPVSPRPSGLSARGRSRLAGQTREGLGSRAPAARHPPRGRARNPVLVSADPFPALPGSLRHPLRRT